MSSKKSTNVPAGFITRTLWFVELVRYVDAACGVRHCPETSRAFAAGSLMSVAQVRASVSDRL